MDIGKDLNVDINNLNEHLKILRENWGDYEVAIDTDVPATRGRVLVER